MSQRSDDFAYLILSIVAEIPEGKVASYGQIAALAGFPRNARKVGSVLKMSSLYGSYPCHRVVRGDGGLVIGWVEQRALLEREGIIFNTASVNMKLYQWKK